MPAHKAGISNGKDRLSNVAMKDAGRLVRHFSFVKDARPIREGGVAEKFELRPQRKSRGLDNELENKRRRTERWLKKEKFWTLMFFLWEEA